MRLSYGDNPREDWQEQIISAKLSNEKINIDVEFEPGLNVVIGNSSSGKTLLVDSIYDKIKNETNSTYKQFDVGNLVINNPSGMTPHYFRQNYILELIKADKDNNMENSLSENAFIKTVFPFDDEFEKKINQMLQKFKQKLQDLIKSANKIELLEEKINPLQNFTRLFYLGECIINPLLFFQLKDKEKELLNYDDDKISEIYGIIKNLENYQMKIAFCNSYEEELNSIRKKIENAYGEIKIANKVNKIIYKHIEEEKSIIKEKNSKKSSIIEEKSKLLKYIKQWIESNQIFATSFNEIIQYNFEIETKTVQSAGHKLYMKNNFKLSKEIVVNALNQYIKNKIPNESNDIKPSYLFKTNFLKRPIIKDYNELIDKVYNTISKENKVTYAITHKNGDDFSSLSPGMKASVILDIILGYNNDNAPLIIDQPEDNLATNYINYDLIEAIKNCKNNRQIIMVSHNATIPMLGDAQCIIVCQNDKTQIKIKSYKLEDQYDSTRSILDIIAEITDGGKSSIKKRFKKYNMKSYREEKNEINN